MRLAQLGAVLGLALILAGSARSQTTLLSEGFEGVFPGAWSIGDSNAGSGLVYWRDVNSAFGTVAPHTGNWKGYCAGYSNGVAVSVAQYTNNMDAYMMRSVNFAGYSGANLSFWYNIPSIESCCDSLLVYMDSALLFQGFLPSSGWQLVTVPLNAYVGGSHTLRFHFHSDVSIVAEGAYLDDIRVTGSTQPFAQSLLSLDDANYSGYVLASDTLLGRSNIQASAQFSVENFTGTNATYTNVLSFRLINANTSAPHPIYGFGNVGTNAGYTYNITNVLSLAAGTNLTLTNIAYLRPAAWMSQFDSFQLECRLMTNGVLAQTLTTAPQRYYHFTNTVSGDAAYNVLLNFTNTAWSRRYLVETIPGQDTFQATVDYEIRRWDDFDAAQSAANVPIRFNYTLRDSAGNSVPLASNSQTFLVPVTNYSVFFFQFPSFRPASHTLNVEPAAQLDSVHKTYYLDVTISHTNNPVTGQVLTANSRSTPTNSLLHFNGKLLFGAISTTMASILNNPVSGAVFQPAQVLVNLQFGSGSLDGKPSFTYGPGIISAGLQTNGDAVCQLGSSIGLNPPVLPDEDEVAKVRFRRGVMTLNSSGLNVASLFVTLPAGMGYASSETERGLIGQVTFSSLQLNQQLLPASDPTYVPAVPMWVTEESKPLSVRVNSMTWVVNSGRFIMPTFSPADVYYVRAAELTALEGSPVPASQKIKPSNEAYYRWVNQVGPQIEVSSGTVVTGAQLTAQFELDGASAGVAMHFPYLAAFRGATGHLEVNADRIDPATSYLETAPVSPRVTLPFSSDCILPSCGTNPDNISQLIPDSNRLGFTQEGGLVAAGPLTAPLTLRLGWISTLNKYAHQTSQFTTGRVHLAGHFIRGQDSTMNVNLRPATILFAGADALTGVVGERPNTSAYATGDLDYAGFNFRCGAPRDATDSGMTGQSTLGGGDYGPYPLKKRSKYYVRKSGVSGIHDKVFGSPQRVPISGYDFTLENFGLAFLSNDNVDSRTEGSLFLPHPSNYTLEFDKLLFLCNGALDKATVSDGMQSVVAAYWQAPLDVSAMEFTRKPGEECDPSKADLGLGVAAYMAHVPDTLYGILGVFPHGNLIPKAYGNPGLDSRFSAPSQAKLRGPKRAAPGETGFETYYLTPTAGTFLNILGNGPNYNFLSNAASGPLAVGFMSMPSLMKVSFFQALEAHLQTASIRPPPDFNDPGPWGVADVPLANGSWSGTSFFTGGYHDPDNHAFPGSVSPASLENYRSNGTYFVHAKQKWLGGAIEFDYPVKWDFPSRSFRSMEPVKNDFLLVNIEHRIAYLSAEHADVRFGARVNVGLPQISISSFVVNTLDDATGMAKTFTDAVGDQLVGALNEGMTRFSEVLSDRLDAYVERFAGPPIDGLTDGVYAHLMSNWNLVANDWNGGAAPSLNSFFTSANNQLQRYVFERMGGAGSFLGGGLNQVQQLQQQLDKVVDALDKFIGPGGLLEQAGDGSIATGLVENLTRSLIKDLVGQIDQNLAAVVGSASAETLSGLIAPYLEDAEPSLRQLRAVLVEVRGAVVTARNKLNFGGEFLSQINSLFTTALGGEFAGIGAAVNTELSTWLNTFGPVKRLPSVSADVVKKKIRQAITDRLFGTAFMASMQVAIKQRVFEINNSLRSGMDSVFGQVNDMIKGALSSALTELDEAFAGVLGDFGGSMGTAALDGYALFNGDALKKVRIDGKIEWAIPEKTGFNAFIEVNQFFSGPDGGYCGNPGVDACEVTVGANDVHCNFLSPDLRINAFVKFTFDTTGSKFVPANFAGGFEKTAGDITFEAFKITDLAVAVAFGEFENYVSAALGLEFNSYKAKGGIFFGRTCTLDPIKMWDPLVAEAIGEPDPTFTGGYVYAECHVPVSECILGIPATCFFEVTAGMGLGIFYFVEGPTFGARGALEVGGSALCILSLNGRVDMVGLKQGSKFKLTGKGTIAVEIGICPFCIEASKSVTITTETGGGKAKGSSPSVK